MNRLYTFIREEKKYVILFLLTVTIFSLFFFRAEPDSDTPKTEQMRGVRYAEEVIQSRVGDETFWRYVIEERRELAALVLNGIIFVLALIAFGVVVDVTSCIQLLRGRPLLARLSDAPRQATWPLRDLFKVPTLFASMSLLGGMTIHLITPFWPWPYDRNMLVLLHATFTDLAVFFCVIYFVRTIHQDGLRRLGLTSSHIMRDIKTGFIAYCGVLPIFLMLLAALITATHWMGYEPPPHPLVEVLVEDKKTPAGVLAFSLFLACFIGPVVEEILFRGFCYPILRRKWGVTAGVLVTSLLFALSHQSGFAFLPVFVLGAVLALLYERRGTLWPSITVHVMHNCIFLGYILVLKALFLGEY